MNPSLYYPQSTDYNSSYLNTFYNPTVLLQIPAIDIQIIPAELIPLIEINAPVSQFSDYFLQHPILGKQLSTFIQEMKVALQYNATGKQKSSFKIPWTVLSGETYYLNGNELVGFYYTVFANNPNLSYMAKIIHYYLYYMNNQVKMRSLVQRNTPYVGPYISNNYNRSFNFY
jgi:hypothetical protein